MTARHQRWGDTPKRTAAAFTSLTQTAAALLAKRRHRAEVHRTRHTYATSLSVSSEGPVDKAFEDASEQRGAEPTRIESRGSLRRCQAAALFAVLPSSPQDSPASIRRSQLHLLHWNGLFCFLAIVFPPSPSCSVHRRQVSPKSPKCKKLEAARGRGGATTTASVTSFGIIPVRNEL